MNMEHEGSSRHVDVSFSLFESNEKNDETNAMTAADSTMADGQNSNFGIEK
jgi:hypothetical protein